MIHSSFIDEISHNFSIVSYGLNSLVYSIILCINQGIGTVYPGKFSQASSSLMVGFNDRLSSVYRPDMISFITPEATGCSSLILGNRFFAVLDRLKHKALVGHAIKKLLPVIVFNCHSGKEKRYL